MSGPERLIGAPPQHPESTLPIRVHSMIKTAVTPKINALSTLWILSVLLLLALVQWLRHRNPEGRRP